MYSTEVSLFAFSLARELRGVVLGNERASVSSFSLVVLLRGVDIGGDCASELSELLLKELVGDWQILLESVLTGLGLALGWQIKASPSSAIQ